MMMIGFFLLTLNLVTAKEWALDDSTRTTIIAGVGSSDSSTVKGILAATANGVGAYVQNYDGNAWDNHPIQAAMLLQLSLGKLVLWYLQEKRMSRMILGKLLPLPQILLVRASAPSFSEKKEKVSHWSEDLHLKVGIL